MDTKEYKLFDVIISGQVVGIVLCGLIDVYLDLYKCNT